MHARRGASGLEVLLTLAVVTGAMNAHLAGAPGYDGYLTDHGASAELVDNDTNSTRLLDFQGEPEALWGTALDTLVYTPSSGALIWEEPGLGDWSAVRSSFVACRGFTGGDTGTHEIFGGGDTGTHEVVASLLAAWGASEIDLKELVVKVSDEGDGDGLLPFTFGLRGHETSGGGSADSAVACLAYDASAGRAVAAVLAVRNGDRLFDRPDAVSARLTLGIVSTSDMDSI